MFIRPLPVRLGIGAFFQEKHLAWRKLPPGEAQVQPAQPSPAAGGPCVREGDEVTRRTAWSLTRVPCSLRYCSQTCFPGNRCGVFSLPPFSHSPLCVWLRGLVAAALTAGEKLESGFVGRPALELPASLGLPSSAHDTAVTATILGSPDAAASRVGPGPLPWGPETAAHMCVDFHKLPPPPTAVLQVPYPGGIVPQPTGRSASVLPAADAA